MKTLCIIPARGGSKRIPRKNIRPFLGKPIIYYSIKKALESNCFNEIMVSTDDIEIKKISEKYGASVPFMRSDEKSGDNTTIKEVIINVLNNYRKMNMDFDYVCCIFPTAPLIDVNNIIIGLEKIKKYNYLFTIVPYSYPIQRSLILNNKAVFFKYPENINVMSQELETHYHDAGQFYWINVKNILKTNEMYSKNNYTIILNELEVQDIDTETDWVLAEMKYKLKNN